LLFVAYTLGAYYNLKETIMDTCNRYALPRLLGLLSASVLFISLFLAQSVVNLGHAAEQPVSLNAPTQLAWWYGPGYPRDYYARHYWGGWHPGPYGCTQRCFHNRFTGAVVRCERVCN
jgi:hypothetical protein